MGIKNLHGFLKKKIPHVYEEVHLSEYAFKRVAVDAAIYLCKFKTSFGVQWLSGFVQMCAVFRDNGIHPVFIFDNVFPPEKNEEKRRRADARIQTRNRLETLRSEWEVLRERLITIDKTRHCSIRDPAIPIDLYSFLFKTFISTDSKMEDSQHVISINDIDLEFDRLHNTLLVIDPEDNNRIRRLLDILRIPHMIAIGEAEATASYLNMWGIVDAVLTDDTDVLAYGCPVFLHRLNIQDATCTRLRITDVVRSLGISSDAFLDFCILCGTDYNSNIPGIGCEKAFRLLKERGRIEDLGIHHEIHYHRVREIFQKKPVVNNRIDIPLCDIPDAAELSRFLFENNIVLSDPGYIMKQFTENRFIIYPSEQMAEPVGMFRLSLLRPVK